MNYEVENKNWIKLKGNINCRDKIYYSKASNLRKMFKQIANSKNILWPTMWKKFEK